MRAWSSRKGCAGFDAQLVDQTSTDFCVGAQGLGLPSVPVQDEDEQLPQALAQRVFPAQRLQFAGELTVAPQAQVSSGPGFDRHQSQLVQMGPFGIKKTCISELGQRLAAPQAEGLAQSGRRRRHLAVGGQPLALRDQLLEADDVDLVGSGGQGVAGFGGEDRRRPEGTAQLADLRLQGIGRVRRLPVAPQQVDQPVGADRLPPLQRQQG